MQGSQKTYRVGRVQRGLLRIAHSRVSCKAIVAALLGKGAACGNTAFLAVLARGFDGCEIRQFKEKSARPVQVDKSRRDFQDRAGWRCLFKFYHSVKNSAGSDRPRVFWF
jgi:hypothetical protein